jgi:hypothetical protein
MKHWETTLAVLAMLSASMALADDFKTINDKEYKNATVSRVEPDGITVKFSGGVVKIPFTELPKELQEKYHYNPEASQKFAAESADQIAADAAVAADTQNRKVQEGNADRFLQQVRIFAIIKPFNYGKEQTTAYIEEYEKYWKGPTAYDFDWRKVGEKFTGVIDERLPDYFERGDVIPVALYRIGHTDDSSRGPLYTLKREKAMKLVLGGQ